MGGLLGGGGGDSSLIGGPFSMIQGMPIVGEVMPGAITQSLPRGPRQEELGYGIQPPLTPQPYTPFRGLMPPTGLDMPSGPGALMGNPNAISPIAQAYPQQPQGGAGAGAGDPPMPGAESLVQMGGGGPVGMAGGMLGGLVPGMGGGGMPGMGGGLMPGMPGGMPGGGGIPFGGGIPGGEGMPGLLGGLPFGMGGFF